LLSLWGLLHLLGGGLAVGSGVLYGYVVIPIWLDGDFTVLRFDQIVHCYGFGLVALIVFCLLRRSTALSNFWIGFLAIFSAMGAGALNELIEFLAVLTVLQTGVGGYYNTGLDIVANAVGAVCATLAAPYLFGRESREA
jgi:putative membrane protein